MNDHLAPIYLNNNICQTNQCYQISENILNNIDFNIDPCDDFYQYSCGSWLKNTHLDPGQSEASQFYSVNKQHEKTISTLLQSTYEQVIKQVMDKSMLPQTEKEIDLDQQLFNTMKNYFDACMNTTLLKQLGATPIYPHLLSILKEKDLTPLILSQVNEKEFPLFHIDTIPDNQQPHRNAIWLYKVNPLLFHANDYTNKTFLQLLEQDLFQFTFIILSHASKEIQYQSLDLSKEEIHKKVNHTILFEGLLSNIIYNIKKDKVTSFNYSSFSKEFATKNKIINWIQFLNQLMNINTISSSLLESTNIYISDMDYFDALSTWMQQTDKAKEIIHDYIFIRYIYQKAMYVDESLFHTSSFLFQKRKGKLSSRLDYCASLTSMELDQLVGRYFILYTQMNEEKRNQLLTFLKQLQTIWQRRLIQRQQNYHDKHRRQTQWLDDPTITFMLEKLNKMTLEPLYDTIYPDLRSPTSLFSFYNHHHNDAKKGHVNSLLQCISSTRFFQNTLLLHQLEQSRAWFHLYHIYINGTIFPSTKVDNQDLFPVFTPNAFYIPDYNKIIVPAGLMFPPFFYSSSSSSSSFIPSYLNMGSLGMILGHELTHAFDLDGRLYNSDGKKGNWWSNDTITRFMEKVQCFIDQYSNMTMYDEKNNKTLFINGKLTLSENLADNGGLSVAYDTLKAMQEESSSSSSSSLLLLPNMNHSPEQLFFISFAQSFCSKLSSDALNKQVTTNNHPPTHIRVNAVIQNSEVFASHFHCPVDSKMNPKKKCKLW